MDPTGVSGLVISDDGFEVSGVKGFRACRSKRGVCDPGNWFCEVQVRIDEDASGSKMGHVRLGWVTEEANLHGPVGYDEFGYAYRDVDGSKVHKSWRHPYSQDKEGGFRSGDVIGTMLELVPGPPEQESLAVVKADDGNRDDLNLQGTDAGTIKSRMIDFAKSKVRFFKNGVDQGVAFEGITPCKDKGYFVGVSLYYDSKVKLNFGPDFKFPPQDWYNVRTIGYYSEGKGPEETGKS